MNQAVVDADVTENCCSYRCQQKAKLKAKINKKWIVAVTADKSAGTFLHLSHREVGVGGREYFLSFVALVTPFPKRSHAHLIQGLISCSKNFFSEPWHGAASALYETSRLLIKIMSSRGKSAEGNFRHAKRETSTAFHQLCITLERLWSTMRFMPQLAEES